MNKNNLLGNIGKIIFGVAIIWFTLYNNEFYFPVSAQAIGADIVNLALIALGVWVIFKGKWSKK